MASVTAFGEPSPALYGLRETPVFQAPPHKSNSLFQLAASLSGDVFTCCDRATRVRSRPLVCYGEKSDYGQLEDLAA
jgi:hypothetical protein